MLGTFFSLTACSVLFPFCLPCFILGIIPVVPNLLIWSNEFFISAIFLFLEFPFGFDVCVFHCYLTLFTLFSTFLHMLIILAVLMFLSANSINSVISGSVSNDCFSVMGYIFLPIYIFDSFGLDTRPHEIYAIDFWIL